MPQTSPRILGSIPRAPLPPRVLAGVACTGPDDDSGFKMRSAEHDSVGSPQRQWQAFFSQPTVRAVSEIPRKAAGSLWCLPTPAGRESPEVAQQPVPACLYGCVHRMYKRSTRDAHAAGPCAPGVHLVYTSCTQPWEQGRPAGRTAAQVLLLQLFMLDWIRLGYWVSALARLEPYYRGVRGSDWHTRGVCGRAF